MIHIRHAAAPLVAVVTQEVAAGAGTGGETVVTGVAGTVTGAARIVMLPAAPVPDPVHEVPEVYRGTTTRQKHMRGYTSHTLYIASSMSPCRCANITVTSTVHMTFTIISTNRNRKAVERLINDREEK
ncbi:hypothetical protein MAR_009361, partial [Mya arenaria]